MGLYETRSIQDYIYEMTEKIRRNSPVDTGALKVSIDYAPLANSRENEFGMGISMKYYGLFQDKGVNGIADNVGSPYSFKTRKKGLRPQNWITTPLDEELDGLAYVLVEAMWKNLKDNIEQTQ